jgi:hypothetical protein
MAHWALGRNVSLETKRSSARSTSVCPRSPRTTSTTKLVVGFTCECGRVDCSETMLMTIAAYEAIRAHSTHFGVVPQHEQPEIESVIERHPSYFVVEKREQDAQEVARESDPRA